MEHILPGLELESIAAAGLTGLLQQATGAFVAFTLVIARMSGLLISGPVFGHPDMPLQVRAFLALALSLVVTPVVLGSDQSRMFHLLDRNHDERLTIDEVPPPLTDEIETLLRRAGRARDDGLAVDEFRLPLPLPKAALDYAWLALIEFAVGAALGLGVLTIVSGLQMAGSLIDQQIGVSLGETFNPEFEINATLSGELLNQLGLVVYLIAGGHYLIVGALVDTFQTLPVGYAWVSPPAIDLLRDLVHQSLILAVHVSAPVMATMAVVGLALGFLGHTIPQINVLVIGFPVRTAVGLVMLGLGMVGIAELLAHALPGGIVQLREALMGM